MFFEIDIQRIRLPSSCLTSVPSCRSLTATSARPSAAKADLRGAVWPLAARMDDQQYHSGGQMRGTVCLYWQADSELTCCPCPRSGWTWRRGRPFYYKSMGCVSRSSAASCRSSIQGEESCFGEACSGCGHATRAFAESASGDHEIAGPPGDTVRKAWFGLPSWHVLLPSVRKFLWAIMVVYQPMWVHCAPPCTFWR